MNKWDIYLQEAKTQAEFAKRSFTAFREAEEVGSVVEVFFHLHHFLVHATNIDRILDTKPGSERHGILNGHLDLLGIDLKPFRRLRNHLEHFDERLDRWVRDFEGHAFFDMNIITGAKGFPEKAYLRALDGDTFKLHGESYNMNELYAAVVEIDRRLTTTMSWHPLDKQMSAFADRLQRYVKLPTEFTTKLATTIASEVRFLPIEVKSELRSATPVSIKDRLSEIQAFQSWMDAARGVRNPSITRAQVITQNYICFVYLPESLFRVLAKHCEAGSATRKCAQFLSNNPVRAFRNAVAHANWTYRPDFNALVYWARKGAEAEETPQRFEVEQDEMSFWQSLSKCLAYAALTSLSEA